MYDKNFGPLQLGTFRTFNLLELYAEFTYIYDQNFSPLQLGTFRTFILRELYAESIYMYAQNFSPLQLHWVLLGPLTFRSYTQYWVICMTRTFSLYGWELLEPLSFRSYAQNLHMYMYDQNFSPLQLGTFRTFILRELYAVLTYMYDQNFIPLQLGTFRNFILQRRTGVQKFYDFSYYLCS